jgi:hypothetical protein
MNVPAAHPQREENEDGTERAGEGALRSHGGRVWQGPMAQEGEDVAPKIPYARRNVLWREAQAWVPYPLFEALGGRG